MRTVSIFLIVTGGYFGFLAAVDLANAVRNQQDLILASQAVMYLLLCGALLVASSVLYRIGNNVARLAGAQEEGHRSSQSPESTSCHRSVPNEQAGTSHSRHPGQLPHPPGTNQTYLVKLDLCQLLYNRWIAQGLEGDEDTVRQWLAEQGIVETPDGFLMDDKSLKQFKQGEVIICRAVARNNINLEDRRLQSARRRAYENMRET